MWSTCLTHSCTPKVQLCLYLYLASVLLCPAIHDELPQSILTHNKVPEPSILKSHILTNYYWKLTSYMYFLPHWKFRGNDKFHRSSSVSSPPIFSYKQCPAAAKSSSYILLPDSGFYLIGWINRKTNRRQFRTKFLNPNGFLANILNITVPLNYIIRPANLNRYYGH